MDGVDTFFYDVMNLFADWTPKPPVSDFLCGRRLASAVNALNRLGLLDSKKEDGEQLFRLSTAGFVVVHDLDYAHDLHRD